MFTPVLFPLALMAAPVLTQTGAPPAGTVRRRRS